MGMLNFMTNVNLKTFIENLFEDYVTETEAYTLIGDPFEIRIPPPTITLTTNKSILSYSDNDTATCTVTAVGKTNDYSIDWYIDDEYITNTEFSNNTCSYTYNSQGEGDITIRANLINSEDTVIDSETVIIADCITYIGTTSTATNQANKFNNAIDFGIYDGTDIYFAGILKLTNWNSSVLGLCVTNNVVTSSTSPYPTGYCDYRLFFDSINRGLGGGCQSGGDYGMNTTSGGYLINEDVLYEMFFENGQLTGKLTKVSDGTVLYNQTITPPKDYTNYHFSLFLYNASTVEYKDIIIKPIYNLELSTNNSILSYYDEDTTTLTATLTKGNNGVNGKTIAFYNGETLLGTSATDSNGEATLIYESQGISDVDIVADWNNTVQSNTITIEDCLYYDASSSDNVSNYSTNNTSISYDSTNQAYLIKRTGSDGLSSITRNTLKFPNTVKIEADVMMSGSQTNIQCGLGLLNSSTDVGINAKRYNGFGSSQYTMSIIESTRTAYGSNETSENLTASEMQLDTWYHIILEINGTSITYIYKQGDTVIKTITASSSVLDTSNNEFAMWIGLRETNSTGHIKNIKIKPLITESNGGE